MEKRWVILWAAMSAVALAGGCANSAKMTNDPFLPEGQKAAPKTWWPFSKTGSSVPRHRAGNVSTAGIGDPFYNMRSGESFAAVAPSGGTKGKDAKDPAKDLPPLGRNGFDDPPRALASESRPPNDPLLGPIGEEPSRAIESTPAVRADPTPAVSSIAQEAATQAPAGPATDDATRYASLRRRLDDAGARNFRSEKDPSTGKFRFACEVPHPQDQELMKVFETQDPVDDELKAMNAVTEAVEEWAAGAKSNNP